MTVTSPRKVCSGKLSSLIDALLTSLEQRGVILGNGNVSRDIGSLNDLRKSIAMHEATAHRVLYLRGGHDPIKRSPYGGAIQSFASARQLRLKVIDFHPLGSGQRSVILCESTIHCRHGFAVLGFCGRHVSAVVPVFQFSQYCALPYACRLRGCTHSSPHHRRPPALAPCVPKLRLRPRKHAWVTDKK